jgi:hypothetical protein
MTRSTSIKAGALAAGCAAVGAIAGIAGTAAAPSDSKQAAKPAPMWRMHGPPGRFRGGPPIHSEAVVPKRSGSGFETVTEDNGKLKSRSGDELTITEGTRTETYKDVTITIPSDATVVRNGKKASLDDLKDDDFVHVAKSPEGTFVVARDANFRPRFQGGRPGFRHERGGGPPPWAPPGNGP